MAVALIGYVALAAQTQDEESDDWPTITWPAGSAVGHLGVVVSNGESTLTTNGWVYSRDNILTKILTATDIATPLTVDDTVAGLVVLSGTSGFGRVRSAVGAAGVSCAAGGGILVVASRARSQGSTIDPAGATRLGDVLSVPGGLRAMWSQTASATGYIPFSGCNEDATYTSFEVLEAGVSPAPTLIEPAYWGSVASLYPVRLSWAPSGDQSAAQVRVNLLTLVEGATAAHAADVIQKTSHGLATGTRVVMFGLTGGAGLTEGLTYYVINPTAHAFQISLSSGGQPVTWTTDATAIVALWVFGADQWVTAAGALTGAVASLATNRQYVDVVLPSVGQWAWSVRTAGSGAEFSPWAAESFLISETPPGITGVSVTSGGLGDLSPTVSWTVDANVTGMRQAFRVRLCPAADATSANPVWDSGVVASSALTANAPATTAWTNGQSLAAWVTVWDDVQPSAETKGGTPFAVTWTPITAPTQVMPRNQVGKPLALDVVGVGASYEWLQVQYSTDGGTTWVEIAEVVEAGVSQPIAYPGLFYPGQIYPSQSGTLQTVELPLAPYGVSALWRVRMGDVTSEGATLWSDWTVSPFALANSDPNAYLVNRDCTDWLKVWIVGDSERIIRQGVTVSDGIGATFPRVDYGVSAGEAGSTRLYTGTRAAWDALHAWIDAQGTDPFWFRWNPERTVDEPAILVARSGALRRERVVQVAVSHRITTLDWVQQQ